MKKLLLAVSMLAVTATGCKKEEPKPMPAPEPIVAEPSPTPAPVPVEAPVAAAPPVAPAPAAPADALGIMQAVVAAIDAEKFDEAAAFYTDDIEHTLVGSPMPAAKGKDALKAAWGMTLTSIGDKKHSIRRVIDGGDRVAMHVVLTGTHKGPMMGVPATGKPIGFEALHVMTLENGKIKKTAIYANFTAVMSQIGAAPGMPPAPIPTHAEAPEVIKGEAVAGTIDVTKAMFGVLGSADLKGLADVVQPDVAYTSYADGMAHTGIDANRKAIEGFKKAFPDLAITPDEQFAVGPWVVTLYSAKGTHKGDMGPMKATNKPFHVHGAELAHVVDGKLKHVFGFSEPAELMIQLGLMPAPPPPAPGAAAPGAAAPAAGAAPTK